ncbi:MAG: hypothetical protein M3N19_01215, partial [Candidatus Eremiobacteraeota bacterium]|nr:hypothetical protein [Candidatus Eremiobacteraeota bacterium]
GHAGARRRHLGIFDEPDECSHGTGLLGLQVFDGIIGVILGYVLPLIAGDERIVLAGEPSAGIRRS